MRRASTEALQSFLSLSKEESLCTEKVNNRASTHKQKYAEHISGETAHSQLLFVRMHVCD